MRKYIVFSLFIFIMSVLGTGCKKSDSIKSKAARPEVLLTDIAPVRNANGSFERLPLVHLYSDTVYLLTTRFVRQAGERLIIDPGTIIKVDAVSPQELVIMPGGTIEANGTVERPIIFTANTIQGNQQKNWGGITIQGRSVSNVSQVPADPLDNSGRMQFVRIEFASLVLDKVGTGTKLENIQVSYASQSSFEFKGGTVNCKYFLSYACGGQSDFYVTEGYAGNMQYLLGYRHPFFGDKSFNRPPYNSLSGIYIENNSNDPAGALPQTKPSISNLTIIGTNAQPGTPAAYLDTTFQNAAIVTTGNARFKIRNSIFLGFPSAAWYLDDAETAHGLEYQLSDISYSGFHSNNADRVFYLKPGSYLPFGSGDFREFELRPQFHNLSFEEASAVGLKDPFNYETPDPSLKAGSPLISGADFSAAPFTDVFFDKVTYIGANGDTNWLQGWTNFQPLKTNYNFPQ